MLNVVHSLPGRTRIHLESSLTPAMIECFIRSHSGVYSATYTKETGNVLIHHDRSLSLYTLKKFIRPICSKKIQPLPWRKFVPIAACGAMFLANWYIQSSPVSLMVKRISHLAAILTSVATSLGVIKNGTLSLIQNRKANADTLTATSIFAALYLGNPGSALVITMMSTD